MRRTWVGSVLFVTAMMICGSAGYPDPPGRPDGDFEQRGVKSHPLNLVVNGSFESRQAGEPPVNIETLAPGEPGLTSWEVIDSPAQEPAGSPRNVDWVGPDRWKAVHGHHCLDLDGGVRQVLATMVGIEYELRFHFASNPEPGPPPQHLRVLIDDRGEDFRFEDNTGRMDDLHWAARSVRFTAQQATTTLTFVNLAPNFQSAGIALDRVEVVPAGALTGLEPFSGRWTIEFANGVNETVNFDPQGTARVVEPLRTANGTAKLKDGSVVIAFEDDRLERWTFVGREVVVEHWFPAIEFATGSPVLGIGKLSPR